MQGCGLKGQSSVKCLASSRSRAGLARGDRATRVFLQIGSMIPSSLFTMEKNKERFSCNLRNHGNKSGTLQHEIQSGAIEHISLPIHGKLMCPTFMRDLNIRVSPKKSHESQIVLKTCFLNCCFESTFSATKYFKEKPFSMHLTE